MSNPEVRDEIARIAGFWTELGIDGFRMDAVPALLQTDDDAEKARLPDPHEFLRDLRSFLGRRNGQSFLLGEANLPHDQQRAFFGTGERPGAVRARSTSSRWPTCGCRWPAVTPPRWRTRSRTGRRSRPTASGRPSSATTTS